MVDSSAGGGVCAAAPSVKKMNVIIVRAVMSDATTRGIRVEVESEYLADRSDPDAREYYFAYHVRISNVGSETSQLVSREWIITDGNGHVERVQGPGVVGEFPVLNPGQSYQYTSFCPLSTEVGMMHGAYTMRTRSGETFEARIAPFTLAAPGVVN
jgi:ApaG protein